jgi:hypothetical protein
MLRKILKCLLAGFVAFAILNGLCLIYYNIPVVVPSKNGSTNYVYGKSKYYSKAIEGWGYGKINNEGLQNINDYGSGEIDILMMGSSHMEGFQVPQKKTAAALLNKAYGDKKYIYNLGMGAHGFSTNIKNFKSAINYYKPK